MFFNRRKKAVAENVQGVKERNSYQNYMLKFIVQKVVFLSIDSYISFFVIAYYPYKYRQEIDLSPPTL